MTVQALLQRMRTEFLDDAIGVSTGDSRWSDADLIAYLNWSERELCRRLHLIVDTDTTTVCRLTVAKVVGVYPRSFTLSPLVLQIERLKYSGVLSPLSQRTRAWLDRHDPGWDERPGTPTVYIVERGKLTFNRQPEADATVSMTVARLPLAPMVDPPDADDTPELEELDDELIHGALSRAYLKDDRTTFDPARASRWAGEFADDIARLVRDQAALTPDVPIMRPEPW